MGCGCCLLAAQNVKQKKLNCVVLHYNSCVQVEIITHTCTHMHSNLSLYFIHRLTLLLPTLYRNALLSFQFLFENAEEFGKRTFSLQLWYRLTWSSKWRFWLKLSFTQLYINQLFPTPKYLTCFIFKVARFELSHPPYNAIRKRNNHITEISLLQNNVWLI